MVKSHTDGYGRIEPPSCIWLGDMRFAGCNTDSQPVAVLIFLHTEALIDDLQQLTASSQQPFYACHDLSQQVDSLDRVEAVFIEVNAPEGLSERLELVKSIRLSNQTACIFILVTHTKSFSSINCYLAGVDHCLKLPVDPHEKKALLANAVGDSHWKVPARLALDRTRLFLSGSSKKIEISYTEMIILDALLRAPQHVMSQDDIAKTLDPNVVFYDPRALEKTISRLRTKIKKAYNVELIFSVRAYGYRLRRGSVSG